MVVIERSVFSLFADRAFVRNRFYPVRAPLIGVISGCGRVKTDHQHVKPLDIRGVSQRAAISAVKNRTMNDSALLDPNRPDIRLLRNRSRYWPVWRHDPLLRRVVEIAGDQIREAV